MLQIKAVNPTGQRSSLSDTLIYEGTPCLAPPQEPLSLCSSLSS